jgi:hypothetical protein
MGVMNGQVDDDVDFVVGEEVVERRVSSTAMLLGEGCRAGRIEIGRGDEPDLRVGESIARIPARDVAGSDDSNA